VSVAAKAAELGLHGRVRDVDFLSALTLEVFTAAHVMHYGRLVFGHALRRRLRGVAQRVGAIAEDQTVSTEQVIDEAEKAVFEATRLRRRESGADVRLLLDEFYADLDQVCKDRRYITGTATGYAQLDQITQGLQPGDLALLAARPSVGKTSLALNIARHAAQYGRVAVFSLEMSRKQLVQRLVAAESHVDGRRLKAGSATPVQLGDVAAALGRLSQLDLVVDDGVPLTVGTLRSAARRLAASAPLALVVVDYIGLMQADNPRDNRVSQVAQISGGLKALARELEAPVLALSQLSRGVEQRGDHNPLLSDLRDSGALEQDADLVLFLHKRNDDGLPIVPVDLVVAKHRNGPTGTISLLLNKAQTLFTEQASSSPPPA
jgi:replicative DNA helicase